MKRNHRRETVAAVISLPITYPNSRPQMIIFA